MKNLEEDSKELKSILHEAFKMKDRHFEDVLARFIIAQEKYSEILRDAKTNSNSSKDNLLYLEGLVDGINLIVQPFKAYVNNKR